MMRLNCRNLVKIAAGALPIQAPIYEFGAYLVDGRENVGDLRPFFPGKEYVGCDMREGPGVDRILNLHNLDLADDSVATIIAVDTLEHVEYPRKAMDEMHRVLKPGGVLLMTSVMNFPIHNYPYDYWRFTPEAFRSLVQRFPTCWVGMAGQPDFPHTVAAVGIKAPNVEIERFAREATVWSERQKFEFEHVVAAMTPPALLPVVKALGRVVYKAIGRQV